MRVFVEEVDMDWNPCPDPVKDPTRHPRSRPVTVRRLTANTPHAHPLRCTQRDPRFPQRMT
jgi:hypothetical protein